MAHPEQADLAALIEELSAAGIEFIVVGGAAAVLHGAPVTTLDLDIVPKLSKKNVAALAALLDRLDAYVREPGDRGLRPTLEHLQGPGHLNLITRLGPLDSLGALHDGRGFEELLPDTTRVSEGQISLLVLDLPSLIKIKSATGRAKDRLVVPLLLALLDEEGEKQP